MKLIDKYNQWIKAGNLNIFIDGGLCNQIPHEYKNDLQLLTPTSEDYNDLRSAVFWGCEFKFDSSFKRAYSFTPLRQNIVLFICAMNDEL